MADMSPIATVSLAMLAGSLRVSTPFLFVSLGECLTEKAGRINLGNEGVLVLGAMVDTDCARTSSGDRICWRRP